MDDGATGTASVLGIIDALEEEVQGDQYMIAQRCIEERYSLSTIADKNPRNTGTRVVS